MNIFSVRPSRSKADKEDKDYINNNFDELLDNGETQEEEKKYCICNRISFGEMIGCDNDFVFND